MNFTRIFLREADAEAPRWPAISLDPRPLEYFGDTLQPTLPSRVQPGITLASKVNNTESSSQSHSKGEDD